MVGPLFGESGEQVGRSKVARPGASHLIWRVDYHRVEGFAHNRGEKVALANINRGGGQVGASTRNRVGGDIDRGHLSTTVVKHASEQPASRTHLENAPRPVLRRQICGRGDPRKVFHGVKYTPVNRVFTSGKREARPL